MTKSKRKSKEVVRFITLLTFTCLSLGLLLHYQTEAPAPQGVACAASGGGFDNTFKVETIYNGSSKSDTTLLFNHGLAISYVNSDILNPHNMNITSATSTTSFSEGTIDKWSDLTEQEKDDIINDYGVNWSEKNVPILYVEEYNDDGNYGALVLTGTSSNPGKKLIVVQASDIPTLALLGRIIMHEYGHNARLNHTDEVNLMNGIDADDVSNDLSTDIEEIDGGGDYTLSQSSNRNQVDQLKNWDGWP